MSSHDTFEVESPPASAATHALILTQTSDLCCRPVDWTLNLIQFS